MKKWVWCGCLGLSLAGAMKSQTISIHHPELQYIFEDSLMQLIGYHDEFKPLDVSHAELLNHFPPSKPAFLFSYPTGNLQQSVVQITPVIDASGYADHTDHRLLYKFGQGVYMYGALNKRVGFEISAELLEQGFSSSSRFSLDSLRLIPGHNLILHGAYPNTQYTSINGLIYWKPISHMTLKAGNDKQFWGDGNRSLILSEYAAAYPFVQLNIEIWRIKYIYQMLFLQDLVPGSGSKRFDKYASMHMLSYNVSRRFNCYAFETVVWRAQDSTFHRTVDVNYINPFLLFRPVEWSIGSADNVLLGLGARCQVFNHVHLYGQLLLDDFSTTYIGRYGWGWYGNKHGIQGGFKIFGKSGDHPGLFQLEYNIVRPYTYSHDYTLENYGYLNRPLAHPYGANFKELVAVFRHVLPNGWMINSRIIWTRYGADPPGIDEGSDIYTSDEKNRGISGNFVGQGILTDDLVQQLDISRMIMPSWRLRAGISFSNLIHIQRNPMNTTTTYHPAIEFGFKTLLYE